MSENTTQEHTTHFVLLDEETGTGVTLPAKPRPSTVKALKEALELGRQLAQEKAARRNADNIYYSDYGCFEGFSGS